MTGSSLDRAVLPPQLAAHALRRGDPGHARYTAGYLRGGDPALVLRPQTVEEVQQAVLVAREHRDVPLGVLSAGHGISGRSLNHGGLVVDVGALHGIEVLDAASGHVRLGPGARWLDVARVLGPHGLAVSSGDHGGVGVGGLATAGGIGWFAREHGLTIDHLRAVDVVLADGRLVRASPTDDADLFWAVRGAGANVGVAVSFELTAVPVGLVGFAQLVLDVEDVADFLPRWGAAIEAADRSVTGQVVLGPPRGGHHTAHAMLVVDHDDPAAVVERLAGVAGLAPLRQQAVTITTYEQVIGAFVADGPQRGRGEPHARSGLAEHLTPSLATEVAGMLDSYASSFLSVRAVGGAVADVPADATAYGWRSAGFALAAMGSPASGLDERWERLLPHLQGLYLSFETTRGEDVLARAFPPAHLARLRRLKGRYDPTGLFRDNFFVTPVAEEPAEPAA